MSLRQIAARNCEHLIQCARLHPSTASNSLSLVGRRNVSRDQLQIGTKEPKVVPVDEKNRPNAKWPGVHRWWEEPVRVGPETSPLHAGPDFTFKDGRPTPFSSKKQRSERLHQMELGKKIVQYLAEMKESESEFDKAKKQSEMAKCEYLSRKPKSKGMKLKST